MDHINRRGFSVNTHIDSFSAHCSFNICTVLNTDYVKVTLYPNMDIRVIDTSPNPRRWRIAGNSEEKPKNPVYKDETDLVHGGQVAFGLEVYFGWLHAWVTHVESNQRIRDHWFRPYDSNEKVEPQRGGVEWNQKREFGYTCEQGASDRSKRITLATGEKVTFRYEITHGARDIRFFSSDSWVEDNANTECKNYDNTPQKLDKQTQNVYEMFNLCTFVNETVDIFIFPNWIAVQKANFTDKKNFKIHWFRPKDMAYPIYRIGEEGAFSLRGFHNLPGDDQGAHGGAPGAAPAPSRTNDGDEDDVVFMGVTEDPQYKRQRSSKS